MDKAANIFKFLKEYNKLHNPVVTDINNQKWSLDLMSLPKIAEIESIFYGQEINELDYIRISKPTVESCPIPDAKLLEWIINDWKNIDIDNIEYHESITRQRISEEGELEFFEELFDDKGRLETFEKWICERNEWRKKQIPNKKGLDIYSKLFRLYSDIKKESESVELIIGDGILNMMTQEGLINHPVLLQKVFLEFEPKKPMFTIKCEEIKTEIYSAMLRSLNDVNSKMLTDLVQEIDNEDYQINDYEKTKIIYEKLVHILDEKGEYVDNISTKFFGAQITSKPVMFLRKRTLGYENFINSIINDLEEKGDEILPEFFLSMIGNHEANDSNYEVIEEEWNYNGIDKDILLTLPANNEQLRIIKLLSQYGAVLVQGPPGTGKTHTIANLIGHLLSQGKSVLVTSHTEKALSVLKDKVYRDPINESINLQNLCISLLSSKSQKKEMDKVINEIDVKSTNLDLHVSKNKIDILKNERLELTENLKKKNEELLDIRSLEYKDIIFDNETIKPIDAAKYINKGERDLNFIPGKTINDTVGFPLDDEEVEYIYSSNNKLSSEEETTLNQKLPAFESLWTVDDLRKKITAINECQTFLQDTSSNYLFEKNLSYSECEILLNEFEDTLNKLNDFTDNQKFLVNKTVKDSIYNRLWLGVLNDFEVLISKSDNYDLIEFNYDFTYDEGMISSDKIDIVKEIIDSDKEYPVGKLASLFKPKWADMKNNINCNGKAIEKKSEYEALLQILEYKLEKKTLIDKINKLLVELEIAVDYDDSMFEEKAGQKKNLIISAIEWYQSTWLVLIKRLITSFGLKESWIDNNPIDLENPVRWIQEVAGRTIIDELKIIKTERFSERNNGEINSYIAFLKNYILEDEMIEKLLEAVEVKDIETYEKRYDDFKNVLRKNDIYSKRKEILSKIESVAPMWAVSIRNREGIHGQANVPMNIKDAWKWRQLVNQMDRLNSYDSNEIQEEIVDINKRLMKNSQILACESAWYEKIKNTTSAQKQAISGWSLTIKQIGKGTGKNALKLKKEARELMPLCQTAIPVWIMPLSRVVENFDPRCNKFDVIIIDEASQSDILALSALYLGKKVIIVGDHEQVSPSTIGVKKDDIDSLKDIFLKDIPNNHLFNGETSLYDMAKISGFKSLMLSEHFRCLPEIIQFSNALSYDGRIKPLRDSSKVKVRPALVEYRVENGLRQANKVNYTEALHVASIVCAMVENPIYKGKTIGVIAMLGDKQSLEIDKLIQRYISPIDYENYKIQCGSPSQFQGDERDIIIISLVDGPNEKGGPVRLVSEDGYNDMHRKRYNVATSRAKDQLWVVHSFNPEIDLKADDIRLRLIKYAQNSHNFKHDKKIMMAESPFEQEVMTSLLNKGYQVIPQFEVGSYRIDMVVEDGDNKIALECDGERWHTQDDLPNDLKRQSILERLGWRFIRIRGSVYYRNPENTMKHVYEKLGDYGINPNFKTNPEDASTYESSGLRDAITRKAAEYRNLWLEEAESENNQIIEAEVIEEKEAAYIL